MSDMRHFAALGLEFIKLDLVVSRVDMEMVQSEVPIVDDYRAIFQPLVVKNRLQLGEGSIVHDCLRPLADRLRKELADVNFSALTLPRCVLGFEHRGAPRLR